MKRVEEILSWIQFKKVSGTLFWVWFGKVWITEKTLIRGMKRKKLIFTIITTR